MAVSDILLIVITSLGSALFSEGSVFLLFVVLVFILCYSSILAFNLSHRELQNAKSKNRAIKQQMYVFFHDSPRDICILLVQRKKAKTPNPDQKKRSEKRIAQYEQTLQDANRDMNFSKMQSMLAVGFSLIALFAILSAHFGGRVIAKLPFEPMGPVRIIAHRGIDATLPNDCSFTLIYILCGIVFRANIQRVRKCVVLSS
jgi:ABC-type transport system involved in cytochrome bd biosynthesis fused ATPase/permease subunit